MSLTQYNCRLFQSILSSSFLFSAKTPKPSADFSQCRTSIVHNDVTLVGGINAGKFNDLGDAENMSICTERCCIKDACDVAFMLEGECYGVTCVNDSMCDTRPARNPARYNPKIVYVHHEKKKGKRVRVLVIVHVCQAKRREISIFDYNFLYNDT